MTCAHPSNIAVLRTRFVEGIDGVGQIDAAEAGEPGLFYQGAHRGLWQAEGAEAGAARL